MVTADRDILIKGCVVHFQTVEQLQMAVETLFSLRLQP